MKGLPVKYSKPELDFIQSNCKLPRTELHFIFCNQFQRVDISKINISSLCKRNSWLTGRTGCFEKGNIPHINARPKGANSTSFKKGNRPHNWKPIGSTRVTKDGYIEIKTQEPKTWKHQHVVNWESKNGKTPNGFCVSFIDGNKRNIETENLELISRLENLQINRLQYSSQPNELKPTVKAVGKLVAKTIEVSKSSSK